MESTYDVFWTSYLNYIYVLYPEGFFPDQPLPIEKSKVEIHVTNQNIIHYC